MLQATGRWSNPVNAISGALTLTQHQRKVTDKVLKWSLSRDLTHLRSDSFMDDLSHFERTLADRSQLVCPHLLTINRNNNMKTDPDIHSAAQALGRLGGLAKSKAKAEAVRENGKLGGRPLGKKDTKPRKKKSTDES